MANINKKIILVTWLPFLAATFAFTSFFAPTAQAYKADEANQAVASALRSGACGDTGSQSQILAAVKKIPAGATMKRAGATSGLGNTQSGEPVTGGVSIFAYYTQGQGPADGFPCSVNKKVFSWAKGLSAQESTSAADRRDSEEAAGLLALQTALKGEKANYVDRQCSKFTGTNKVDCTKAANAKFSRVVTACNTSAYAAAVAGRTAAGNANYKFGEAYENNLLFCFNNSANALDVPASAVKGLYSKVEGARKDAGEKYDKENAEEEEKESCSIDGIGWIVCPVMNFMADLNDKALELIGDNFLNLNPDLLGSDTKNAWGKFRDLANVIFVIAFLIIIYSQITGAGLSNYGVKRMLPRLVVIVILVNVSFYLCQIAVDISNIVGNSVNGFISNSLTAEPGTSPVSGGWKGKTGEILGLAAGVGVALVLLITIGPMALIALVLIVLILVARKALVILLVVTAPIAIVAYLLPNTQNIFKKWFDLFKAMLYIYPIIGLVFGASTLAAGILAKSPDNLVQLSALGVMAIPLLAVPLLLKGAFAATGAIGAKLSGGLDRATNSAKKGGMERLTRRGEDVESRMAARGGALGAVGGYRARKNFNRKAVETNTSRRQEAALAEHVLSNPGDRYDQRQIAEAGAAVRNRHNEEVKSSAILISSLSRDAQIKLAEGGSHTQDGKTYYGTDAATREAAISTVASTLDSRESLSLASSLSSSDPLTVRQAAVSAVAGKTPILSGSSLGSVEDGTFNAQATILTKISQGSISTEWIAEKSKGADIDDIRTAIASVSDDAERARLQGIVDDSVRKIQESSELRSSVVRGTDRDIALAKLSTAHPNS